MTPTEEWHLPTRRVGRRVLVFDRLDSTNTRAAALAEDPGNGGVVVLAKEQSAGRGQHGRSWHCPPGMGVLMSVLLFPPPAVRRPALLTAWAAVSVCETAREAAGLEAQIKWPNDVLIRGKKVCGILIEQGRGTVAGIGLNVNQADGDVARAGLTLAGALAAFTGKQLDREEVFRRLVGRLDEEYHRLCLGEIHGLEARWKDRLGLLGREVVAQLPEGPLRGCLVRLSFAAVELELA